MKKSDSKHPEWRITIGIEQQFRGKVRAYQLQRAARAALEVALPPGNNDKFEISLFVTDESGITALNKKYRKIDRPTDVLSFSFTEKKAPKDIPFISPVPLLFLGEVVLCYPYIVSQAELEGQLLSEALAWTTIHGVLHLMGRKHYKKAEKKVMQAEEQAALAALTSQGRKDN